MANSLLLLPAVCLFLLQADVANGRDPSVPMIRSHAAKSTGTHASGTPTTGRSDTISLSVNEHGDVAHEKDDRAAETVGGASLMEAAHMDEGEALEDSHELDDSEGEADEEHGGTMETTDGEHEEDGLEEDEEGSEEGEGEDAEHEDGQEDEDDDGIRYIPSKSLLALEDIQKKIAAGTKVSKDEIRTLVSEEHFDKLGNDEILTPVRVTGDASNSSTEQSRELDGLLDAMAPAQFVNMVLLGRSNVSAEEAVPMSLGELMESSTSSDNEEGAEKDGDGVVEEEDDGIRYIPNKSLASLEEMQMKSLKGLPIAKGDILALINEETFDKLPDHEVMVPIRLEGQQAAVQSEEQLSALLDTMGTATFLETFLKGRHIPEHTSSAADPIAPVTLAELRESDGEVPEGEHEEDPEEGEGAEDEDAEHADANEPEHTGDALLEEPDDEAEEPDADTHEEPDHTGDASLEGKDEKEDPDDDADKPEEADNTEDASLLEGKAEKEDPDDDTDKSEEPDHTEDASLEGKAEKEDPDDDTDKSEDSSGEDADAPETDSAQLLVHDAQVAAGECGCVKAKCFNFLKKMMLSLDTQGTGTISFEEWEAGAHKHLGCKGVKKGGTASKIFTLLDKNNDKFLAESEVTCLALKYAAGKKTCEAMYASLSGTSTSAAPATAATH